MTVVPLGEGKRILDEMDCDCFIGKLCKYKHSAPDGYWFLVVERATDTSYGFPLYNILHSTGMIYERACFDRNTIEEVKL